MKVCYKRRLLWLLSMLFVLNMSAQLKVLQEDFESGIPASWTQERVTGTYDWVLQSGDQCTYPTGAWSGDSRVWFYSPATSPAVTRLITAPFDASELALPAQIHFSYALPSFGAAQNVNDTLRVYARTNATAEWFQIGEFIEKQDFWTETIVALPMKSATLQIAFEAKTNGGRGVVLDAVKVQNVPVCGAEITGLTAGKQTPESVSLNWVKPSDLAIYDIKISTTPITDFTQPAWKEETGWGDNTYFLDGLTPETTYYAYVRSDCGDGDVSPWTELSFTTDFTPVDSFNEGFEDYPKGSSSSPITGKWKGFKQGVGSNSGYAAYVNSGTNAASGSQFVQLYPYHTVTSGESLYSRIYLVSPALVKDMDWASKQLRFKMMSANVYGKMHVGISTHPDPLDFSEGEFEELAVFDVYDKNIYEEKILPLNGYEGNGRYIVFYVSGLETKSSVYYYLDDIVLEDAGTDCAEMQLPAPKVSDITATGATLTWNGLNATRWNVKVSSSPIDPEITYGDAFTGTVETNPSHTVNGLTGGTAYYAYVQPVCADGVPGKWSMASMFFTEIDPAGIAVPYFQNFDAEYKANPGTSGNGSSFPRGWTRNSSVSTTAAEPYIYTTCYSAPAALRVRYSGSGKTQYSIFALPKFTESIDKLQVRCKVKAGSSTYHLYLIVGVVADPVLTKDTYKNYTLIDTLHVSGTQWEEVVLKLDKYEGDGGHIVFLTPEDMSELSSQQSIYIDDLYVEKIGGVVPPTDLAGELTNNSTVSLTWKSEFDKFEVLYGAEGLSFADPANQTQSVTGTTTTVGGLQPNRTYDFYVRVKLDDGTTSNWTGPVSFTTAQTPAALPYESGFEDGVDNAQWTLVNGDFINKWRVGTATKKEGNRSMYVTMPTNDNTYSTGTTTYLFAYRVVDMKEPGLYDIGFSWKAMGRSTSDFMRVFVVPDSISIEPGESNGVSSATATPVGWRTLGEKYNLQAEWQDTIFVREMFTEAGKYKLLFFWKNSTGTNVSEPPAAAVDQVFFKKNDLCMTPVEVKVDSINDVDAVLNFIGYNTEAWDLKLSTKEITVADDQIAGQTADTYDGQISTMSYKMTGLQPFTKYYYYLRTSCNDEWQKGSFTTKCKRSTLTLWENFDEYGTGNKDAFPPCWTKLTNNSTSSNQDYPYIVSTYYNGVGALDMYAASSTYNAAVSPMLDVEDLSKVQIRLQGYATNASAKLIVGAISDAADRETFFPVDTLTVETVNQWEYFEVPFDRYAGKGDAKYIALLSEKNAYHFLVDSVVIEPIPACRTPRELTVKEDAYSAALSWNGYGAGAFNVKVATKPIDPTTETGDVYDNRVENNSLNVDKLRPLNRYYWYVQAVCGEMEMGEWSKETYFETLCPYYALPLRENFDGYGKAGSGVVPDCWIVVKGYKECPYIYTLLDKAHSLPGELQFETGAGGNYQVIATPRLYVDDISTLQVSFWGRKYTSSNAYLIVGVMTDPTDLSTFVPVDTVMTEKTKDYAPYTVNLSSYTGEGKYIAFSNQNGSSTKLYIDDVVISDPNKTCVMPDNLMALEVTDTEAKISWSDPGMAEFYNLKLSTIPIVPDMEEGDLENVTGLEERRKYLTGLQPSTTYYVYVQSSCGSTEGTSYWTSLEFDTRCAAVEEYVDDFSTYEKETDIRNLCWSSYLNVLSYDEYPDASKLVYPMVNNAGTTAEPNMALELAPYYDGSDKITTEVWAISPLIANLQGKQLQYRYKFASTLRKYQFVVGVMSDWSDQSTFVAIDTLVSDGTTDWHNRLLNFSEYAGAKFVAFRAATDKILASGYKVYVDDINLQAIPACAPAYDIRVAKMGSTTVDVAWKPGNATTTSWNYVLTDRPVDLSVEAVADSLAKYQVKAGNASAPTCTIADLISDTEYWFYITPSCGTAYYPEGLPIRTACDLKLEIPYYEDFSSYGTTGGLNSSFPNCWYRETNYLSTSVTYPYITATPAAFKADMNGNVLYMYTSTGTYVYAVTPEINTDDIRSLRARFKIGAASAGRELIVGIASVQNDTATFVPVDTVLIEEKNKTYDVQVPFENYEGTGKYLAFKAQSPNSVYIGELNIEENSSCALPAYVREASKTDSTFTVTWNKAGGTQWEVRYGLAGFDVDNPLEYETAIVTDSFFVAKQLTQLTDYDVYVRGVCGENEFSPWIRPITVRTKQIPLQIPFATDFEDADGNRIWSYIDGVGTTSDYFYWRIGEATASEEGGKSLYLTNDEGKTSDLGSVTWTKGYPYVYTTVDLPEGIYEFSFKWKGSGDETNQQAVNSWLQPLLIPDSVELKNDGTSNGYSTFDLPDGWIEVPEDHINRSLDWTTFKDTIVIGKEMDGIYKFAFLAYSLRQNPPYAIDDLSIVRTAPTIGYLRLESVTKTTATFDWLSYNADSYTIRVFDKPMDVNQVETAQDYVKEQTVYNLPATIDALSAGSQYYMYVKAVGASGSTEWIGMPFSTACDAVVTGFPLIENFEADGFGYYAYPSCWTKLNNMTKYEADELDKNKYNKMYIFRYYVPHVADSLYYSGFHENLGYNGSDGALFLSGNKSSGTYSVSISPEFAQEDVKDLHLQFQLRRVGLTTSRLVLGVMDNPADISTFIRLDSIDVLSSGWEFVEWSLRDYDLTGIQAKHVALMAPSAVNTQLIIDDLRLGRWEDHDIYDQICKGYPYRGYGFDIPAEELMEEGTQVFSRKALRPAGTMGNDSIINLHLTVAKSLHTDIKAEICEGDVYTENGFNVSEAGQHQMVFTSVNGCDSIVTLNLKVNKSYLFEEVQKSCPDQLPYRWRERDLMETGVYYDSLLTVNTKCDSIYVIDFQVVSLEETNETIDICESELPYDWNGLKLIETGSYSVTLSNVNNCDSVVNLTLNVHEAYDLRESVTICNGGSFSGYGFDNITKAGEYKHEGVSVYGCDSTFTLVVTVATEITTLIRDTICNGDVYNPGDGFDMFETATEILYTKTIPSVSVSGCDSTVSLIVTKLPTYQVNDAVNIAESELPYQYGDTVFEIGTVSGKYIITNQTVAGCDSIVNLTLTIGGSGLAGLTDGDYFNITPNPIDAGMAAYINCEFSEAEKNNLLVEIYTSTGSAIQQFYPREYPVNVGKYMQASGVYMVRVVTGTGKVLIGRVIVR